MFPDSGTTQASEALFAACKVTVTALIAGRKQNNRSLEQNFAEELNLIDMVDQNDICNLYKWVLLFRKLSL